MNNSWPASIESGKEIAEYIEGISPDEVDTECIEDLYSQCRAVLQLVPISSLSAGPEDYNIACKKKTAAYARMATETMPPILVEDDVVMDGNHRFREAIRRGMTSIWIYRIIDLPDLALEISAPAPAITHPAPKRPKP